MDLNAIYKINSGIVSRAIAGENIKVPTTGAILEMQKIYSVNKIGEFIWQKLDGNNTLSGILSGILTNFDVSKERAETDLLAFVKDLAENNLIAKV